MTTKNLPSFLWSMTSMIVLMLTICVMVIGLMNFWRTGEVLEIFNSLVSGFVGAYLQRSMTNKQPDGKIDEPTEEKPSAPVIDDSIV